MLVGTASWLTWRKTVRVDRFADAAWRSNVAPFDGLTASTPTIPTALLLDGAAVVVDFLARTFPSVVLYMAEDWLEHDGYVNEPEMSAWTDLRAAVASREALIKASPCDTYVRRAWHGDRAFYFRWHYYDESDSPFAADVAAGGDLDVTAGADVVAPLTRELGALGIDATAGPASIFFRERWNG